MDRPVKRPAPLIDPARGPVRFIRSIDPRSRMQAHYSNRSTPLIKPPGCVLIGTRPYIYSYTHSTYMEDGEEVREPAEEDEGHKEDGDRPGPALDDPEAPVGVVGLIGWCGSMDAHTPPAPDRSLVRTHGPYRRLSR